ncbi:MAG: AAA family ATPase [Lachnospiraceae bacterium]|nr:AAA family ATPase [Lachnospiraceae bacterium]
METIKINKLEIENTKRVKAVKLEPSENGLTIIGGNNNQGKTSVLDSIAWALGGEKYRPSQPVREGSTIPPYLKVVLNNGLVVERKGKNSSLKVTDPSGQKGGQKLLDSFVEQFALDLPKFMEAPDREKAKTLLNIIGVEEQLEKLERQEKDLYSERLSTGRLMDRKKKFADEMPYYPDVPEEPVSASNLIREQQAILAQNGENQRKRDRLQQIQAQYDTVVQQLEELTARRRELESDLEIAQESAENLQDMSTAELERSIENVEEINRKVRANLDKDKADEDARYYEKQYENLTAEIEEVREQKNSLLDHANLPLPGLSVRKGELTYQGQKWDNMSGSDRLKVSTAIVRCLNPRCGFVLLDKLEQMDMDNLNEFGAWLEQEGLQAIATRVSTGDECSIIITDGYAESAEEEPAPEPAKKWRDEF